MADSRTRQELYERIRAASKDEVILAEMIKLGFWPSKLEKPDVPADLIKRQGELQRELRELVARKRQLDDPEQALRELRKQRMKAAREKRKETKAKHERARYEKALAWRERKKREILYLGDGVSAGLNNTSCDTERLQQNGLPEFADTAAVAQAMGISLAELRFLAFTRTSSPVSHYQRFSIAKKSGGTRLISAPMPRLKRAHYWLLDNVLGKIPVHPAAHGFLPGHSIVSNARLHVGADIVINDDLKDFFPSVSYRRVKGVFRSLGYSEAIASLFGLLCTEPEVDEVELDGETFFIARGPRHLPQGAPTSPMITNLLCRRLDARLAGSAKKLGFSYSRYADDMTFSGSGDARKNIAKLLWRSGQIITAEGFTLHPDKRRIMRANQRQEVTGLVVNEKPAVDRPTLRRFRALLQQLEKDGPAGKHWGQSDDVLASAQGFAHYVAMVDPVKGAPLVERVRQIRAQYSHQLPVGTLQALHKAVFRREAAAGVAPRPDWWQPSEPATPEAPPVLPAQESAQESVTQATQSAPTEGEAAQQLPRKKRGFSWLRFIITVFLVWLVLRLLARLL